MPATGVLWLAVFWRQFERHNYWMFYLGPAAAVLSACALSAVRDGLHRVGVGWGLGAMLVGLVVVVGFGMRGTDRYFSRVSYPPQEVAAWREVHDRTRAGDRVLLYRNPVRLERRGDYLFRNLVPPQQAYYLDRAFDVEADFQAVVRRAPRYAAYIIPIRDAVSQGAGLGALRVRFAEAQAVSKVFFDLRVAAAGDEPGVGRRVP